MLWLRRSLDRLTVLFTKEIWHPAFLADKSPRGRFYALLRVIAITLTGLNETRATSRAAALSFSMLLGLGPLIGLAALVAGFAVGGDNPELVARKLNDLLQFVAPSVSQYQQAGASHQAAQADAPETPAAPASADAAPITVNPELVNLINNFIAGTRDSAGGIVSVVSIIIIVLLLFTSIEQVFNDIWGVRRGRSWLTRIVFYWTILTLGAVVFFGAVGALSAATFVSFFKEHLPFGSRLADVLAFTLPALSVLLLIAILTLFYRYVPNTRVFWRAAFIGALIVALLLVLNNVLAFFYLQRVDFTRSLYGSLGMLPILMFGLYVFWLFVLVGGQISYAVQNVHYRNSQAAWSNLTESVRERLTLAVLLAICRRFHACLSPCDVPELGSIIKVPTQILNECLNRLVDLRLISPIPPDPKSGSSDYYYQPARPLNRIQLGEFKHLFVHFGEDPAGETLDRIDPLLLRYREAIDGLEKQDLFVKSLDELFGELPRPSGAVLDPAPQVP